MKNWKTTLSGCLLAAWVAVQPILTSGSFDLNKDWKSFVGAALVAALSFAAKDFDVSGNPPQTIEPTSAAK